MDGVATGNTMPDNRQYEWKYDEHEPWKVQRIQRALARIRQGGGDTDEEVRLFRSTHPTLAALAALPESADMLEVMLDARRKGETGELTDEGATLHVQNAVFAANKQRAQQGDASHPPRRPPSPPKIEEVDAE